jgi:hypothetical protein
LRSCEVAKLRSCEVASLRRRRDGMKYSICAK